MLTGRSGLALASATVLTGLALTPAAQGRSWQAPIQIAPLATSPGPPAAALGARGDALAAWTAAAGRGRSRVEVRTRDGYVAPWVRVATSGTFADPGRVPVVAGLASNGAAAVAWRIPGGSVRAAVRARWTGAWRIQTVPGGPATEAFVGFASPRITVGPGGAAILEWAAREQDGWVVRGARRAAGAAAWRELPPLATGVGGFPAPAVDLDAGGDAVAVWSVPLDPTPSLATGPVRAALRSGTGGWGAATMLSADGYAPSASIAGGRALVAWEERTGVDFAGAQVRTVAGDVASRIWSAPVTVATGRSPKVAADAGGDALLSWAGPAQAGARAPFLASLRLTGAPVWPAPATLAGGEGLTALEAAEAHVAIGARGRGFAAVTDPEGPGSATTTLATSPAGVVAWDILPVPVGGDDGAVALAAAASGDGLALLPASLAVGGGDTVLAVSYDGAARPVLRTRISGRRRPDGAVAWTVVVRNAGRVAARGVQLRLSMCCGARLISSRPAGVPGTRPWVGWGLGSLGAGRSTTVRLTVRASHRSPGPPRLFGDLRAVAVPRIAVGASLTEAVAIAVLG